MLEDIIHGQYPTSHADMNSIKGKCKDKAVPLQAWSGPEGSRKLKFPDSMTTAQDGGKVVSLRHRPPLPPGNAPGTHFYYRLSRPQGHSAIRRIMSMKNSNDTIRKRTSDQHLNHCATAVKGTTVDIKVKVHHEDTIRDVQHQTYISTMCLPIQFHETNEDARRKARFKQSWHYINMWIIHKWMAV